MLSYIPEEVDRKSLKPRQYVEILIQDKEIKRGMIKRIISKKTPKDGMIKVELTNGEKGKLIKVLSRDDIELENFKFFNLFFHSKNHYAIYNKKERKYLIIEKSDASNRIFKYMLVFSDKTLADKTLQGSKYPKDEYIVVQLNKNKTFLENVSNIHTDLYMMDMSRVVLKSKMTNLYEKFTKN